MKKEVIILSLGGSQIIPNDVNHRYLKQFKKTVLKHSSKYKFAIVCGGGPLARKYITAIKKEKGDIYHQSLAGINATRANARFVSYFFGHDPTWGIPTTLRTVRRYLKKRGIVFCGALEYKPDQTSDSVAAIIAKKMKGEFINLTNVKGLYTKDPKKYKNTKFIPKISWNDFDKIVQKIKFKPGQHFVLDQKASSIIKNKKIKTLIIKNIKDLDNYLSNKKFTGTIIEG